MAIRSYGYDVGRRYIARVGLIEAAKSIEEIMELPYLNCHP